MSFYIGDFSQFLGLQLLGNDATKEEGLAVIAGGELAGRDAALRLVKEDIEPALAEQQRRPLQRLPVPDPHPTTDNRFLTPFGMTRSTVL